MSRDNLKPGSLWQRWDPHIHSPETILNNQFKGKNSWGDYFSALENAFPSIDAIGLTDYYLLENYEKTVTAKAEGRLPNVGLIFPNVEMRLTIATERSKAVNFHLLISPDDPNHIAEARRFLGRLKFKVPGDAYPCTRNGLIALGRHHNSSAKSDEAALKIGVNQFKVGIDEFMTEWDTSDWIQNNALIAVATSRNDGTAGLQTDASLAALRRKVERMAHIMFAPAPGDRKFWLGRGKLSTSEIIATYGALKPCLHGSDAHRLEDVGVPAQDRYSWIKGDLTFDTLRQACMEPKYRVFVGPAPPSGLTPSQFIKSVSVKDASWFEPDEVPLNPGLVGIIGARGSGKTALVDMIAAGGYSLSGHMNERSFVHRAKGFFHRDTAQLVWGDDEITENKLRLVDTEEFFDEPYVQYLSQQFVETLCSVDGATDELISEIERVIFDAHSPEIRQGATDFSELMDAKAALGRQQRKAFELSIRQNGDQIAREYDKLDGLNALKAKASALKSSIERNERYKKGLVTKDDPAFTNLFHRVSIAAETVRQRISQLEKQKGALTLLKAHVEQRRSRHAETELRSLYSNHADAGLDRDEWRQFLTDFDGDVDSLLNAKLAATKEQIVTLTGPVLDLPVDMQGDGLAALPEATLLPSEVPLENVPLNTLVAEVKRLEALIGIDKQKRIQFAKLTKKIARARAELAKLEIQIKDAEGAQKRIGDLMEVRNEDYAGVFGGILAEETALGELYEPLSAQLANEVGALAKLSVSLKRHVDVNAWAERGEELLDLRRADGFRGHGALLAAVKAELEAPWKSGTADNVAKAMAGFRNQYRKKFSKGSPYDRRIDLDGYRKWANDISQWIYSTDHIRVTYSLQFDGLGIERLSPGTRGIVLLLLYLAIDREDERPLIIDQPEENLDPKSIFDELVDRFQTSKLRRQIIIVTHNANLIVNTDADQVIVATCGPHTPDGLPTISYQSGGLEDPDIRKHVCDILEGGENALKERAKRLRVKILDR